MKALLVPVEHHAAASFPLRLAAMVARRFDSTIEAFALQVPPFGVAAWDPASVAIMNQIEWDHAKIVAEARRIIVEVMREENIAEAGPAGEGTLQDAASWRWNDEATASDAFLGSLARAFDLTVVGRPAKAGASITSLEAALFDSGGPVLIAPPRDVADLGETIVVAWNGSSETARTIAFAKPLLRNARRIVVLADDGTLGHRPSGSPVVERLLRNGFPAELKTMANGRIRSGEAILEEASALGCDLLVKGAYTQSRLRQMIFGGATNQVIAEATIPVFMAH